MRTPIGALTCAVVLAFAANAHAIVGGEPPSRAYPHMGALYFEDDFYCGSSLIRAEWVLTAAHCVAGEDATRYKVQLGTTKRSQGGETIAVVEGIVHPDYDSGGHDLALLRLQRAVAHTPIRVAGPEDAALYAPGTEATAIGWGSTNFMVGAATDDLQEIKVPIRSDAECEAAGVLEYDPETMTCAGETTGGEDTCQGDSGGPLMVPGADGALTLVGATSFGTGCAFPTQHGIYARTATARAWIDSLAGAPPAGSSTSPAPAPGGGSPPSQPPGQQTAGQRVRIYLPSSVGSARKARRAGTLSFGVRASGPVKSVRITVRRGRALVGRTTVDRIVGQRSVKVRVKRSRVKAGRVTLRVTALDGHNRPVKAAGKPKLER
jgi:trypsin